MTAHLAFSLLAAKHGALQRSVGGLALKLFCHGGGRPRATLGHVVELLDLVVNIAVAMMVGSRWRAIAL